MSGEMAAPEEATAGPGVDELEGVGAIDWIDNGGKDLAEEGDS